MSDFTLSRISGSDSWRTPAKLYADLDAEFHFNDDPCPIDGEGGLDREWNTSVFLNPPYSKPAPWCKKAYEESLKGKTVVGLLRGDTSTRWFHDWVLGKADLRFLKGRVCFNGKPAPFASIVAVWNGRKPRSSSTYQSIAQAVRSLPLELRLEVVRDLTEEYKQVDPRFDAVRFSEAAFGDDY